MYYYFLSCYFAAKSEIYMVINLLPANEPDIPDHEYMEQHGKKLILQKAPAISAYIGV